MRILVLSLIALLPGCFASHDALEPEQCDKSVGSADLTCNANQFEHTVVTPHLDYPLENGTNVIMIQYDAGTMPYFALWVDNAELLVPFGE